MKYTTTLTIDAPLELVVALFENPENNAKWQIWLESTKLISGELGQVGAVSQLVYNVEGKKAEIMEQILSNNLPQKYEIEYVASGAKTTNLISFEAINAEQTRYQIETIFEPGRFTVKAMAFLLPSLFRKQTEMVAEQFKKFVETTSLLVPE